MLANLNSYIKYGIFSCLSLTLLFLTSSVSAQDAKELFNEYSDRIYQVRIIELSSGKQAAIGSGFQVSGDGLVISNFHVVSEYAHHPERYRIEYINHHRENGDLQLINIDVINDLALLKLENPETAYINLANNLPAHGESIYSLGNPHDLGLTVVPGTFNGITTFSIYERIHVSGAINPGMSGGPTLNVNGEVIGVNVASSGNQVGFLVPLHRLNTFIKGSSSTPIASESIETLIGKQLHANQQQLIGNLLQLKWSTSVFGQANVPNEIADHIRCWGITNKETDIKYTQATSYCREDESIYISNQFNTGIILYRYDWFDTDELNRFQFYNMLETKIAEATADNIANKENVSNYKCHDDFIRANSEDETPVVTKASYCAREYKKYPGLYDVFYIALSAHDNQKSLLSYFTLAGVSQEMATQFTKKFITSITWN
jgi:serine protease Do